MGSSPASTTDILRRVILTFFVCFPSALFPIIMVANRKDDINVHKLDNNNIVLRIKNKGGKYQKFVVRFASGTDEAK